MDEIDEGLNNSSEGMDTMATAAREVAQVPDEFREQAEAVLASLRQRIAQAMNRLDIAAEDPRAIEAHIRMSLSMAASPRLPDTLKLLELERMVFDASGEMNDRPELWFLYRERAEMMYHIPVYAYCDTVLADGPSIEEMVAQKRAVSA